MLISLASAAGTDDYGNTYPEGIYATAGLIEGPDIIAGLSPDTQIEITSSGGVGVINFKLNNPAYVNAQLLAAIISGFGQITLNGPQLVALADFIGVELNSNTGTGMANLSLVYNDGNGTPHLFAFFDGSGLNMVTGSVAITEPGTGTGPFNPAVAEGPHPLSISGGWGGSATYELLPGKMVCIEGSVVTPSSGSYNDVTFATLPAAYQPGTTRNYACLPLAGTTYGNATFPGAPHVIVSGGSMLLWGIPGSLNGQSVDISGQYSL